MIATVAILLFAFMAASGNVVLATDQSSLPQENRSVAETLPATQGLGSDRLSLGPGLVLANTYRDRQAIGAMGRMIDRGWHIPHGHMVHTTWLHQPDSLITGPALWYGGIFGEEDRYNAVQVSPFGAYFGSANITVTHDDRAVVLGHLENLPQSSNFFAETLPGSSIFTPVTAANGLIWPKAIWQEAMFTGDSILHVLALDAANSSGDAYPLVYTRYIGSLSGLGVWDSPPYVVDTVFGFGFDLAASVFDGKIALVWIANLPDPGDCDTCSSSTGRPYSDRDNDLYFQISYDQGATFAPRINLTRNVDGEDGYRPYTELSALISSNNDLHVGWNDRYWPTEAGGEGDTDALQCRMSYWAEGLGFEPDNRGRIRTVADLNYPQPNCNGGMYQLNGAKMSVSECDDKFYLTWTQFNSRFVDDDCASRAGEGDPDGSANGEIYSSASDNGGITWGYPQTLTNSYAPECDSATGIVGPCASEHWASVTRYGSPLDCYGVVVDPSGSYSGDHYLDVQYIDDVDPGSIIENEGTWQLNSLKWFRLACTDPVPYPRMAISVDWDEVGCPWWKWWEPCLVEVQPSTEREFPLYMENVGNLTIDYTVWTEEDNGPPGWLHVEPFTTGSLPTGLANADTGTIVINWNGVAYESELLTGRVIIDYHDDGVDTIPIEAQVIGMSCCVIRGDINHSGSGPDIADLVYLVAYMFSGGAEPPCMEEANVNNDGSPVPDIADLVYLVNYMFGGGPPPAPCM